MKKILFALLIIACVVPLNAWKCIDCPDYFTYNYDIYSNRNFLPDMTQRLENEHGITTYIKIEKAKLSYNLNAAAQDFLKSGALDLKGKGVIVILVNPYLNKGAIEISGNLKEVFPEKYVTALQNDVLNNLQGKWYLRLNTLLAKITGGFVYMLEKDTLSKGRIDKLKPIMIVVDDPLYRISLMPMIDDIIGLCFAEPFSFVIYFPFIMYFLIVRWFGMKFGKRIFYISNAIWLGLMAFFALLIINRMNIYFPDYVGIFCILSGFNIPLYAALYNFNKGEIMSAAYNYVNEITGGFDSAGNLGGKVW
jgi:hypothetical protein